MKETFFHMLYTEFFKVRGSLFMILHVLLPAAGAVFYAVYMKLGTLDAQTHLNQFVTLLAMVFPVMIAIMTGILTEAEERAGHFQNMLTAVSRKRALLSKICLLLAMGLASTAIVLGGFWTALLAVFLEQAPGFTQMAALLLILWTAQLPIYLIHLFLGMKFGEGVTIGTGIAETMISAVMLTGLGDGIWYFYPPSWGMRFCTLALSSWSHSAFSAGLKREVLLGGVCFFILTVLFLAGVLLWFEKFEGRKEEA